MLYEYKKGIRRLLLFTCSKEDCNYCVDKLSRNCINYLVYSATEDKQNIFFGDLPCLKIIESFNKHKLNELDQKEDFILGTLLGYDISKQCERYLTSNR